MSDPSNPENATAKITAADILRAIGEINAANQRIEAGIARLEAQNAENERRLSAPLPAVSPAPAGGAVADDADLDGQWGNPVVRRDPRDWQGPSFVGSKYSDCPPDYLRMLAGLLDWQAKKSAEKNEMTNGGKPRADFLARDAARCRGWAGRHERKPQAGVRPKPAPVDDPDEGMPF